MDRARLEAADTFRGNHDYNCKNAERIANNNKISMDTVIKYTSVKTFTTDTF